ncbi:hypothetical protein ACIROD_20715 [Peribacillus sp. NPDC101481]
MSQTFAGLDFEWGNKSAEERCIHVFGNPVSTVEISGKESSELQVFFNN